MPPLLLLLLVLPLSICVSSKQYGTGENVEDDLEEKLYKREKLDDMEDKFQELIQRMDNRWKMEKAHLEKMLETKNVEVENLQKQLKEMKVQFESRVEEVMLRNQRNQEVDILKSEMKTQIGDIQSQLKEVMAERKNERGLRDLPFEMVCAFKDHWYEANSVVSYNRTTAEFNNSDRPGGADGTMNIETGVFTTITSGYYIITFSGSVALVGAGESTVMYLHHNGVKVEESEFQTSMHVGASGDYIWNQGSRTVVSIVDL